MLRQFDEVSAPRWYCNELSSARCAALPFPRVWCLYSGGRRGCPYVLKRSRASSISCTVNSRGVPAERARKYWRQRRFQQDRAGQCISRAAATYDHPMICQQTRIPAADRRRGNVRQRRRAET